MTRLLRSRRTLLQGTAALTFAPWLLRDTRAADVQRFALGVLRASRAATAWCCGRA